MGFNLAMFFEELMELCNSETSTKEDLIKVIKDGEAYATECNYI